MSRRSGFRGVELGRWRVPVLYKAGGGNSIPAFLFRESFSADESAPLSSRDADGTGYIVAVQNDGQFSASGGNLVIPAQISPVDTDLYLRFQPSAATKSWPRTNGLMAFARVSMAGANFISPGFGFYTTEAPTRADGEIVIRMNSTYPPALARDAYGYYSLGPPSVMASNTEHELAVVMRSKGSFSIINGYLVGIHSLASLNADPLFAILPNRNNTGVCSEIRIAQLGAPWNTDYGIADRHEATFSAGNFSHSADGFIIATRVLGAGEVFEISFRMTDADNRWIVRIDETANKLYLVERKLGVETNKEDIPIAFTAGNSYTMTICYSDDDIFGNTNDHEDLSIYDATFQKTATLGSVSHDVTNLAIFTQKLSGAALAELEKYTEGA